MFNKIYFKIFAFFAIFIFFSNIVNAQDATTNQYKQMGGIAGLTEVCFKTKNLELTLSKLVGETLYNQPETLEIIFPLLYSFFEAKGVGMEKKVIWNGTTQTYNKKQFDCNNAADKKLIKQFKIQLMNGLKSQG